MTQLGSGTRRARKDHVCTLCELIIPTGQLYDWWVIVDSDGWFNGHVHQECSAAWEWTKPYPYEDLPDPSDFRAECLAPYRLAGHR